MDCSRRCLWIGGASPIYTMLASIVLWLAARQFGWNLPAYRRYLVLSSLMLAVAVLFARGEHSAAPETSMVDHHAKANALFLHRLSHPGAGDDDGPENFSGFRRAVPLWLYDPATLTPDQSLSLSLPFISFSS